MFLPARAGVLPHMRPSISSSGFGPLAPTVEVARAAEASALAGIGASEYVAFQAAVAPCIAYRCATPGPDFGMPRSGPPSAAEASVVGGETGAIRA